MSKFEGADDVYLTSNSIAVRNIKSDRSGRVVEDKTVYYKKTPRAVKQARDAHGRLRYGRKG